MSISNPNELLAINEELNQLVATLQNQLDTSKFDKSVLEQKVRDLEFKVEIMLQNHEDTYQALADLTVEKSEHIYEIKHLHVLVDKLKEKLSFSHSDQIDDKKLLADTLEKNTALKTENSGLKQQLDLLVKEMTMLVTATKNIIDSSKLQRTSSVTSRHQLLSGSSSNRNPGTEEEKTITPESPNKSFQPK